MRISALHKQSYKKEAKQTLVAAAALSQKEALNKLTAAVTHAAIATKHEKTEFLLDARNAKAIAEFIYGYLHNVRIALVKESDLGK